MKASRIREIAGLMNEHYICIKVDREERPDLDQIYMNAVQMLTGRGGWPMSVFLTPDLQPFYGGTYWPPTARMGMPGFDQVLEAVAEAWHERREQVVEQAAELDRASAARRRRRRRRQRRTVAPTVATPAARRWSGNFDPQHGGFGGAPKFPHPMDLRLLLRSGAGGGRRAMLRNGHANARQDGGRRNLRSTRRRLSSLLGRRALAGAAFRKDALRQRAAGRPAMSKPSWRPARPTMPASRARRCDYVLRDMTDPAGGFYSTRRCRQRRRRGQVLRLDARRNRRRARARSGRDVQLCVRRQRRRAISKARNILNRPKTIEQCAALHGQDPPSWKPIWPSGGRSCWQPAASRIRPGARRKVLVSLEGADDRRLGPSGRRARTSRAISRRPRGRPISFSTRCAAPMAGCCTPGGPGRRKFDAYLDDYAGSGQCAGHAVRSDLRRALDRRSGAAGRYDVGAFRRSGRRRIFLHGRRSQPKRRWAGKRNGKTAPPPAAIRWPRRRCCGWASSPAEPIILNRPPPRSAPPPGSCSDFPPPPRKCCWPSISISARRRKSSSSATRRTPTRKPCLPICGIASCRTKSSPCACRSRMGKPRCFIRCLRKTATVLPTVFICENFTCVVPLIGKDAVLAAWKQLSAQPPPGEIFKKQFQNRLGTVPVALRF